MRKKVITVGLFLVGILVVASGAKVLSVESSETVTVITPDTPEEKSYYVKNKEALFRQKQLLKSYKIQYYRKRYDTAGVGNCEITISVTDNYGGGSNGKNGWNWNTGF